MFQDSGDKDIFFVSVLSEFQSLMSDNKITFITEGRRRFKI